MHGTERIFGNSLNILRNAAFTVSAHRESREILPGEFTRIGGGYVRLVGDYTGAADAQFDIEFLTDTISGVPIVSSPIFTGVGSGEMTDIGVSAGVAAQTFTIRLKSKGPELRAASADLLDANLVARTPGAAGNDIEVTIDHSGLAQATTEYSTLEDISKGQKEFIGEHWNFGAPALVDGQIPDNAPRLILGRTNKVRRHYREIIDGETVYRFSPTIDIDLPAGTPIYLVSGDRTVTVSDGVTTEDYENVVTIFDWLSRLEGESSLIRYDGAIADDHAPGAMGSEDLNLFTESYARPYMAIGSEYVEDLVNLTISPTAPTEKILIRCINNDVVGAEQWAVTGTISGALGTAVTGISFTSGVLSFQVPEQLPAGGTPTGSIAVDPDWKARGTSGLEPILRPYRPLLGANATSKTIRYVYTRRKDDDCPEPPPVIGRPDPECLGVEVDFNVTDLPAPIADEMKALGTWQEAFIKLNTQIRDADETPGIESDALGFVTDYQFREQEDGSRTDFTSVYSKYSAVLQVDEVDVRFAKQVVSIFAQTLSRLYDHHGADIPTAALDAWTAAFNSMKTDAEPLEGNIGAAWWRNYQYWFETGAYSEEFEPAVAATLLVQEMNTYLERYRAAMNNVLMEADISPDFLEAGTVGIPCWRDHGHRYWWVAEGTTYLPLQTGVYYHSVIGYENGDGEMVYEATKEFGLAIQIKCAKYLREGDAVVVTIDAQGNSRVTYQLDDRWAMDLVNASPIDLEGGQDGTNELTWSVVGSVAGELADHTYVKGSGDPYDDSGVQFTIEDGSIDFELKDTFIFSAEGGTLRWRKDAGGWTVEDIWPTIALADGLTAALEPGKAPSFVPDDAYSFTAVATYGPGNVAAPDDRWLVWDSDGVVLTADCGAPVDADGIFIANHQIDSAAEIKLQGSDDAVGWTDIETLTWRAGAIAAFFDKRTYQHYRLTISAGAGRIGWICLGEPFRTEHGAHSTQRRDWRLSRAQPGGLGKSRGVGMGATVDWGKLLSSEWEALEALLDYGALNDSLRVGYVPHYLHADEALFVAVADDSIDVNDRYKFNPDDKAERHIQTSLELVPVPV